MRFLQLCSHTIHSRIQTTGCLTRSRWIYDTFPPLLCEMEGGAVAQVCCRNDVPFLSLKSVSDCVLEHHDFFFNFPEAIRELNGVAMKFIGNGDLMNYAMPAENVVRQSASLVN